MGRCLEPTSAWRGWEGPVSRSILGADPTPSGEPVSASIQTPSTSGTGSALGDALDLLNVLHEPTAVFNRINERPRVLIPWLVLGVFLIVLAILVQPYQSAAFEAFKATLTPEQVAKMGNRGAGGGAVGFGARLYRRRSRRGTVVDRRFVDGHTGALQDAPERAHLLLRDL